MPNNESATKSTTGGQPVTYWLKAAGGYVVLSLGAVAAISAILQWYKIPPKCEALTVRLVVSTFIITILSSVVALLVHVSVDYRRRYRAHRDRNLVRDIYADRNYLITHYKARFLGAEKKLRVLGITLHSILTDDGIDEWLPSALKDNPDLHITFIFTNPYSDFVEHREQLEGKSRGRISADGLRNIAKALQIKSRLGVCAERFIVKVTESTPAVFMMEIDDEVYFEPYLDISVGRNCPTIVMGRNSNNEAVYDKLVRHLDVLVAKSSDANGCVEFPTRNRRDGTRWNADDERDTAVFLDRDGVLIDDVGYRATPDGMQLRPGVAEGLKVLKERHLLIVVTNQSGIARRRFTEADLQQIHERLIDLLRDGGVVLDAIYFCPHHPEAGGDVYTLECACRKPKTGMVDKAREKFTIDFGKSYFIGDKLEDMQCGKTSGMTTILINDGEGDRHLRNECTDYVVSTFGEAVAKIGDRDAAEGQ